MVRGVETVLAVLTVGMCWSDPGAAGSLLRDFAICAGRFSAVMEEQWMFDGPGSERTQEEMAAMVSLVEASMPEGAGPQVLAWRVDAKAAQRALLGQARFGRDQRLAETAAARAEALAAECRAMLLG